MRYLCTAMVLYVSLCCTNLRGQDIGLDPLGFVQQRFAVNYEMRITNNSSAQFFAPLLKCQDGVGVGGGAVYKVYMSNLAPYLDSAWLKFNFGIGGYLAIENEIAGTYGILNVGYKYWFKNPFNFSNNLFIEPKVEFAIGKNSYVYLGCNIGFRLKDNINIGDVLHVKR